MRLSGRIPLIAMMVLTALVVPAPRTDLRGNVVLPQHDAARGGDGTKTKIVTIDSAPRRSPMGDGEDEQRNDQPLASARPSSPAPPRRSFESTSSDGTREKTLAVFILMLRHNRGAR